MKLKLFKRNRTYIKYNDCEIPAKLFYNEVIGKNNLSVLGNDTSENLNKAFLSIIDELCELEDNQDIKLLYNKRKKLIDLHLLMSFIDECLYQIAYIQHEEHRNKVIHRLNTVKGVNVRFDIKKGINEEILRVQKSVMGMLRNRIKTEELDEQKKTDTQVTSFEEMTVSIFKITGYKVTDTDTLRTFSVYKKDAIRTNQQLKAKKHGS